MKIAIIAIILSLLSVIDVNASLPPECRASYEESLVINGFIKLEVREDIIRAEEVLKMINKIQENENDVLIFWGDFFKITLKKLEAELDVGYSQTIVPICSLEIFLQSHVRNLKGIPDLN